MSRAKQAKKLMILISGLGQGGAENHLLKILPQLNISHFIVSLTPNDTIGKLLEQKGENITYLDFKITTLFSTIKQLNQIIKKEQPTIIDSYLIHANVLSRFIKPKGTKLINSIRGDYFNRNDFKGALLVKFIEKITRRKVDLWIPNSESLKRILLKQNISEQKIRVLPNCVDVADLKKRAKEKIIWPFDKSDKIIVYVGSLRPVKNVLVIIRALAQLPKSYKVLIIGSGPQKKELENLAKKLRVTKQITFLGQKKNPAPYVKRATTFVLPSFSEGMSNALLEAMALEVPCVVSDIPQNTELIPKENSFDCEDEKALAKLLMQEQKTTTLNNKHHLNNTKINYENILLM